MHLPPWAVSREQRYKNLRDHSTPPPEANVWKRKPHFILNETIMLNWNFPWRYQALMIWNSIVKCPAHMQIDQGRWWRMSFLTKNSQPQGGYKQESQPQQQPQESNLRERGFSERRKREHGCDSMSHKRKEGAGSLTASLLGGASLGPLMNPTKQSQGLTQESLDWVINTALCAFYGLIDIVDSLLLDTN